MVSSLTSKDLMMFELDDGEETSEIATIDTSHQFLNFSRKVTEASSMKKPVDIQLGIACGKDLIFTSPILRRRPLQQTPIFPTRTLSSPITNTNIKIAQSPLGNAPTKVSIEHIPINLYNKSPPSTITLSKPKKKISTTINSHLLSSQQPQANAYTSSPLLGKLVADVLSHMESCPDRTAYSEDLHNLKPKLEAYYAHPSLSQKAN